MTNKWKLTGDKLVKQPEINVVAAYESLPATALVGKFPEGAILEEGKEFVKGYEMNFADGVWFSIPEDEYDIAPRLYSRIVAVPNIQFCVPAKEQGGETNNKNLIMATPHHNEDYEALKKKAKELIAAGACHALSFWSRTDAERLCPKEHNDFEQIEVPVYIDDWVKAGKKAIGLIQLGINLLNPQPLEQSTPQPGEVKSARQILNFHSREQCINLSDWQIELIIAAMEEHKSQPEQVKEAPIQGEGDELYPKEVVIRALELRSDRHSIGHILKTIKPFSLSHPSPTVTGAGQWVKPDCYGLDTWCCCIRCNEYHKYITEQSAPLMEKRDEVKELQDWKDSAMDILRKIDLQQCGKLLKVPLGKDISGYVLPAIKELVQLRLAHPSPTVTGAEEPGELLYTKDEVIQALELRGEGNSIGYILRTIKPFISSHPSPTGQALASPVQEEMEAIGLICSRIRKMADVLNTEQFVRWFNKTFTVKTK